MTGEVKRYSYSWTSDRMSELSDGRYVTHADWIKREADHLAVVEGLRADAERWKDFALHQVSCAVCGDNVRDCDVGSRLQDEAMRGGDGRG